MQTVFILEGMKSQTKWAISRAGFIKTMMAAGAVVHVPFLYKCSKPRKRNSYVLSNKEYAIAMVVQRILFPEDGEGPSAKEIHALDHMQWVLSDERYDPERKDYMLSGLQWVEETAHEQHGKSFLILMEQEKQELIAYIAETGWGQDWFSTMLTLIFEALLLDPIYGVNQDEKGWKWLEHQTGAPRPTKALKYDEVFKTVAEHYTPLKGNGASGQA